MGGRPNPTPCEHCGQGFVSIRRSRFCSQHCSDAAYRARTHESRKVYNREYQRRNPDKAREAKRRYRERNRDELREKAREVGAREGVQAERYQRRQDLLGRDVVLAQIRANSLRRHYKITPEQYDAMLEAQGGGCAICAKTPEQNGRRLAIDHDHTCCPGRKTCGRCVRGLLCTECNYRLGIVEDYAWIARAQAYISEPRGQLEAT